MKGKKFTRLQRRRAQTEGRIGILKQGFLGRPMRAKGFAHRKLALAWGVANTQLVDAGQDEEDPEEGPPAATSGVERGPRRGVELKLEEVSF